MNNFPTQSPSPYTSSPTPLPAQYRAYAIELFAEAMTLMAKALRQPEEPVGHMIVTLERLVAALRCEPYCVITNYERKLHNRATELLDTAYASVNGKDTTEGRAKLYTLVEELRKQ